MNNNEFFGAAVGLVLFIIITVLGVYIIYKGIKSFLYENAMEVIKWILLGILLINMTTCSFTCEISRAVHQMRVY